MSALAGCSDALEARKLAEEGQDALTACDFSTAADRFAQARALRPSDDELAMAYALTGVATLLEHPAVQALAPRFGFTESPVEIDWLWQEEGLLAQLQGEATCESIRSLVATRIPHPAILGSFIDPAVWAGPPPEWDAPSEESDRYDSARRYVEDTFDPTLTFEEVNAALRTMRPELVSLSEALAQAAGSAGGGYAFEGQCGVGSYRFQGTELYLLAAILRLGVAASQLADAYDLNLPVRASFDAWLDRQATESWISEVNERYLRVDDPDAATAAGPHFARGLRFLQAAVESAQSAGQTERGDATFNWGALPSDLLADLAVAMASAQRSLESGGVVLLPQLEPALAIDVGSIFSDPIQRAAGARPFARLEPDEWEGGPDYLVFDWSALSDGVNSRLSPAPFSPGTEFEMGSDADVTWSSAPVWNAFAEGETGSLSDVLDPDGTWSLTYSCSDGEPRNGETDE